MQQLACIIYLAGANTNLDNVNTIKTLSAHLPNSLVADKVESNDKR